MSDDQDRKKKTAHDPSRRKFLKGVGVAGAGAAIADHFINADKKLAAGETVTNPEPVNGSVNIALDVNGTKRDVTVEPRMAQPDHCVPGRSCYSSAFEA